MILAIGALSARDPSEVKSRYHFYVFGLSVPALAFVLAFARDAYVSQIEPGLREHIAGMCIVGTFALSACTHDSSMNTIRRHLVRDIQYALTKVPPWAACSVFLGVLAFGCCHQWKSSGGEPFEEWFARQPSIPIQQLRGHEAVVVVQFRDYQCGPCKAARQEQEPVMRNLQRHYPNEIRFVTMDFPLERECNRFAAVDIHPAACEAAVAVRLAEAQGLREEMERWLWEHQDVLESARIEQAAREVGGVTEWNAKYEQALEEIRADVEFAKSIGVRGTPTLFVNGVRLRSGSSEELQEAILYELRSAGLSVR